MLCEYRRDTRGIADVPLDQRSDAGAGDDRRFTVSRREVVINHHASACFDQRFDGMATDIAGTAGDENRTHGRPIE